MIKTTQIVEWSATTAAQSELPRLVRKLALSSATFSQLAMPAGESVALPGFDGELYSEQGNAWVPSGYSCWELSCRKDIRDKANEDFDKRTAAIPEETRSTRTYVTVTARQWREKESWVQAKKADGQWADVKAYDADDLELWLENNGSVALWFAESLGIAGPGVESLDAYFRKWSAQSQPYLSPAALLAGREAHMEWLKNRVEKGFSDEQCVPVTIKADSVEEAVAFAAAVLTQDETLFSKAVVVAQADGWRYVEKNAGIELAIAARPELAEAPTNRAGLVIVIPYASGDMAKFYRGVAGKADDPESQIERPHFEVFEKALIALGIEENDARRLAQLCGRSWSVFRRQHAINPSIRKPGWLGHRSSGALSTLCLMGTWSGGHEGDKALVSRVSGQDYAEIERQLLDLEKLDDSPVVHIGNVWKAKSALELLAFYGERITAAELDRFFTEVETAFAEPDPTLELPPEERHLSLFRGLKRSCSELLLDALADTLIKLAVRGREMPALAAQGIGDRVDRLIRNLLHTADAIRWLSVSSHLREFAEASPEEFLSAIEHSLSQSDPAIGAIFGETSDASVFGCCWHSDLLWALEILAWAPHRLLRVSLVLAKLSKFPIKGNWSNSPANTLVDIYRSWYPQTAATVEQRIATLDALILKAPDEAFRLLASLFNVGPDHASPSARPKWRDDDAGAGHGATGRERHEMLVAVVDRQIAQSANDPARAAELIKKSSQLDEARRSEVLSIIGGFTTADDEVKETLRSALRQQIHWHRNYDKERPALDAWLEPLEQAYQNLEPESLPIRHAWLFAGGMPQLPSAHEDLSWEDQQKIAKELALRATLDVYNADGWPGLIELARRGGMGWQVGFNLARSEGLRDAAHAWIVNEAAFDLGGEQSEMVRGIIATDGNEQREALLREIFALADAAGKKASWRLQLLLLAPEEPVVWKMVGELGPDNERAYWSTCHGRFWVHDDPEDFAFVIGKLIGVKRPRTAFASCHGRFDKLPPELVATMLDGFLAGEEPDGPMQQSYYYEQVIEYLETSNGLDADRLMHLEFALFPFISFSDKRSAPTLYRAVMTRPELFFELFTMVYRSPNAPKVEIDETAKAAARVAWDVLHHCQRLPGARDDGSIDTDAMRSFVSEVQRLAGEEDLLDACNAKLGEIFAHAPAGENDIFPVEAVRDFLDELNCASLWNGFTTGCMNKRGVTTRGMFDGGAQERQLAAFYQTQVDAVALSHPFLAKALTQLVDFYRRYGENEDLEVRMRIEGY